LAAPTAEEIQYTSSPQHHRDLLGPPRTSCGAGVGTSIRVPGPLIGPLAQCTERLTGLGYRTELQESWLKPRPWPEGKGLADGKDTHGPAGLGASLSNSGEGRNGRESGYDKKINK
jgi:hypothetical protein